MLLCNFITFNEAPVLTLDSLQLNLEENWTQNAQWVEHKMLLLDNRDPKGHVLNLTVLACRGFLGGGLLSCPNAGDRGHECETIAMRPDAQSQIMMLLKQEGSRGNQFT